ncbi:MAG: hypothetical protein KC416_02380 [Myxococcales bacterium]|nr:hypothetical protein [Myxococcales bacterium]
MAEALGDGGLEIRGERLLARRTKKRSPVAPAEDGGVETASTPDSSDAAVTEESDVGETKNVLSEADKYAFIAEKAAEGPPDREMCPAWCDFVVKELAPAWERIMTQPVADLGDELGLAEEWNDIESNLLNQWPAFAEKRIRETSRQELSMPILAASKATVEVSS